MAADGARDDSIDDCAVDANEGSDAATDEAAAAAAAKEDDDDDDDAE